MITSLIATLFLSSSAIQTLPNGTTIAAVQNTTAKRFAIVVLIRAGSAYETKETNGVMHLLEHMLFHGSHNIAPGTIDSKAEQKGIRLNATTFQEFIRLTAEGPAEHWGIGIECINNLLQTPKLDPETIESEKRILKEEIAMNQSDLNRQELHAITTKVFANTPWSFPTSGTPDTIDNLSKEMLLECYQKHFIGANITVVCVSNVATDLQMHALNRTLSFLPTGQKTSPPQKPLPQQIEQTKGRIYAFIGPPYDATEDWITVEAISTFIINKNPSQNRFAILPSKHWSLVVIACENPNIAKQTLDNLYTDLNQINLSQLQNTLKAIYQTRQSKPSEQAMKLALDIFFRGADESEKRNQIIRELNPQTIAKWANNFATKNAIAIFEP